LNTKSIHESIFPTSVKAYNGIAKPIHEQTKNPGKPKRRIIRITNLIHDKRIKNKRKINVPGAVKYIFIAVMIFIYPNAKNLIGNESIGNGDAAS
jgi:hypothetical protein